MKGKLELSNEVLDNGLSGINDRLLADLRKSLPEWRRFHSCTKQQLDTIIYLVVSSAQGKSWAELADEFGQTQIGGVERRLVSAERVKCAVECAKRALQNSDAMKCHRR